MNTDDFEEIKTFETDNSEEKFEVEELTGEEIEETAGGAYAVKGVNVPNTWLAKDSAKKGYKKHCGGIRVSTNNPQITVSQLGARLGKIDKIFIAPGSIPVTCLVSGPMGGPDSIQVYRRTGRLGLVTIEAWGHQKNEGKNYRYAVLRVQFN